MNLDQSFRRLVFIQVLLGVIAFSIAERNPGIMLIAGSLAALSRYLTEGPTNWQMPRWLMNLIAFAVVAWLFADLAWQRGNVIIAIGHFVMWLQILLLYSPRTNRDYGQILVLSLMLMIAASILSVSMVYGGLLAIYCALGLWTVLRFQLKSAADQVIAANRRAAPDGATIPRPKSIVGRGYRWHFQLMATCIGLLCTLIAIVVFVVMPRTGESRLPQQMIRAQVEAGFSDQINLTVNPSRDAAQEPVLNMRITLQGKNQDNDSQAWLLRGAALDYYNPHTHTWRRRDTERTDVRLTLNHGKQRLASTVAKHRLHYEAQITLRNPGHHQLFTVHPITYLATDNLATIRFSPHDQQVTLDDPITSAILYTIRWPVRPLADLEGAYRSTLTKEIERANIALPQSYARTWSIQTERIANLAQQIIQAEGLSRDANRRHTSDDKKIVEALANHLRNQFRYSLENPTPHKNEEPVIEFLFNLQTGHCELFASGLAALCRSINIPARVVTGYRVSEYNRIGGYFVVRQSNAHAWCEVDLGPDVGWQTVDATPPLDVAAEHHVEAGWGRIARELYDYLEFQWIRTVVAYDPRAQEKVLSGLRQTVHQVVKEEDNWIGSTINFIKTLPHRWRLDRINYSLAGIILIAIGVALASLMRTLVIHRRRLAALHLTALPRHRRRGLSRKLRFYLQMLDLLERHGYQRPQWQCPYHFAENLVGLDPQRFDSVLPLTEAFYEIRFGHRDPDAARLEQIHHNLHQLEQALGQAGRGQEIKAPRPQGF